MKLISNKLKNIKKQMGLVDPSLSQPRLNRVKKSKSSCMLPRRLQFEMQAHLKPTKRNMEKNLGFLIASPLWLSPD